MAARDPFTLDDDKKRRANAAAYHAAIPNPFRREPVDGTVGIGGPFVPFARAAAGSRAAPPYDPRPKRGLVRDIVSGYNDARAVAPGGMRGVAEGVGGAIAAAAGQPPPRPRPYTRPAAPVAEAPPAAPVFDGSEFSRMAAERVDPRNAANGLTRIVQTAPGVFTDMAGAQGEERYYDALGNRADTSFGRGEGDGAGMSGPADWARAEQANALDMSLLGNQALVSGRGRAGLRRTEAMAQESAARAAAQAEREMTPELRAERDIAMMQEQGANTRAQMQAEAMLGAAGARANAATQAAAADALRERETYERELLRENPAAFVQEQMAILENYDPEDRIAYLAKDNNRVGGMLRAAIRQAGAAKFGDNFTPGQVTPTHWLQSLGGSRDANNRPWYEPDDKFEPGDVIPGMNDEWWDIFTNADLAAYNRRR